MAVYKDIPRFDGSGITEYYRINTGEIVKLSSDYDSLEDKPSINGIVLEGDLTTADLNIPLGDLAQLKTEIKDNIVNAINELHLEASDFEQSITNKVNSIISFTIVWVEELPEAKDAHHNTVYLVPKTSMAEEGNYCEEYLYTDHGWEKIGDTKVDLSGYYTKTEVDTITNELTEQVDSILEDYATKEELENRADTLEEQVNTILNDYATVDYVQSLGLFEPITPPNEGEIYCVNDGEMKRKTFYEIPRGVTVGYREADGTAKAFGGTINSSYLNKYRALSIWDVRTLSGSNYGVLISEADADGSWVYNPGLGVTKTGNVSSLASAGNFGTVSPYLTANNVTTSLPTSYASFDTKVLSGNVGYKIGQRLNTLEDFQEQSNALHDAWFPPHRYKIDYDTSDLIPDPTTYTNFETISSNEYTTTDGHTWTWTPTSSGAVGTLIATATQAYERVPIHIEGYRYSSSYPFTVTLNGKTVLNITTTGKITKDIVLEEIQPGDVITISYKARSANSTYTSIIVFDQAYNLMVQPYEEQIKEQLTAINPLHQDGDRVYSEILYNVYDDNMQYKDTLNFNKWKPLIYKSNLEVITSTLPSTSTSYQYGFSLTEDGFYTSDNGNGVTLSYSCASHKVEFDLEHEADVVVEYINGGYSSWWVGEISKLDTELKATYSRSAASLLAIDGASEERSLEIKQYVFKNVQPGHHYFCVRYAKGSSTSARDNDWFKYRVKGIETTIKQDNSTSVIYNGQTTVGEISTGYNIQYEYLYETEEVSWYSITTEDDIYSIVLTSNFNDDTQSGGGSLNNTDRESLQAFARWLETRIGRDSYLDLFYDYNNSSDDPNKRYTRHFLGRTTFIKSELRDNAGISISFEIPKYVNGTFADPIDGRVGATYYETIHGSIYFRGVVDADGHYSTSYHGRSACVERGGGTNYVRGYIDTNTWNNTRAFTPTKPYNATTKKYVDDEISNIPLLQKIGENWLQYVGDDLQFGHDKPTNDVSVAIGQDGEIPKFSYQVVEKVFVGVGSSFILTVPFKNTSNSSYTSAYIRVDITRGEDILWETARTDFPTTYGSSNPLKENQFIFTNILQGNEYLEPGDVINIYIYGPYSPYDKQTIHSTPTQPITMQILNKGVSSTNIYTDTGQPIESYITEKLGEIVSFDIEVVDTLPTTNISSNTIYMVPSAKSEDKNIKDEYLYTEHGWEMIGSTKVDLSDYYNKSEVDTLVANAEGNIQAAKDYTDERIGALYLHCSEVEYNALTQQERDSFLVAIVDDMAESGEDVETLLQEILMDKNPTETEDDLTEDEAMAILDEIIEGGV